MTRKLKAIFNYIVSAMFVLLMTKHIYNKKIITICILLYFAFMFNVSTCFAGSIPEDLLDDVDARLYIGTLEDFSYINIPSAPYIKITSMVVTPTKVYKGEAGIGETITYKKCNVYSKLQKNREYLFADFTLSQDSNNMIYVYEIESVTENKISLVSSEASYETTRLEQYISDDSFELAEQERASLGTTITFADFLYSKSLSDSPLDKVIFLFKGDRYEVPPDVFAEISKNIYVTNVKDSPIMDMDKEDGYDSILYIQLFDKNSQEISCAAVTEHGEVCYNSPSMSMLPSRDYEMSDEDVAKLVSLLYSENTEILNRVTHDEENEFRLFKEYNTLLAVSAMLIVVIIVIFVILLIIKRKTK